MYRMCQNDYESIYAKLARNAVLQIAGDFEAPAYWLNRTQVGDAMKQNLRVELVRAYTDVTGFMLLKIDLPDVYEGAPTPVTAFFATAPKMAAMALFARVVFDAFGGIVDQWQQIVAFLAVVSMFLGAIAAIFYAARPPDEDHVFGHNSAEDLAALGQSLFILISAGVITWAAVRRLITAQPERLTAEGSMGLS